MIVDYIGELRLRVRTDVEDIDVVRSAAESIVRAALERCVALLEERAPGRIVFIRRLPLRFHCDETVLDETIQVEELARAFVEAIALHQHGVEEPKHALGRVLRVAEAVALEHAPMPGYPTAPDLDRLLLAISLRPDDFDAVTREVDGQLERIADLLGGGA